VGSTFFFSDTAPWLFFSGLKTLSPGPKTMSSGPETMSSGPQTMSSGPQTKSQSIAIFLVSQITDNS
jgi:hypothetical protein